MGKKNKFNKTFSEAEKIKASITNEETKKKHLKDAEKVDPEFKDRIQGISDLDLKKRLDAK